MSQKKNRNVITFTGMALIFVIIAVLLFLTAGASAGSLAMTKINMAVDLGAPMYQYTGEQEGAVPAEDGQLKKSQTAIPSLGCRYGTILCDRIKLKAPLYYGDSQEILSRGAGQYTGSGLPGEGTMILAGAHHVGYFAPLEYIKKDDIIRLETSYGSFQYKVTDTYTAEASSITQKDLKKQKEELVLYTCYPFGSVLGSSSKRYFVTAEKTAGPELVEDTDEGK